jgi:hypothetical protein
MQDQINMESGAAAAISTSNYGGLHMPKLQKRDTITSMSPVTTKEKSEQQKSSLEQAYWSGMRKRAGLSSLTNTEAVESETQKYEQVIPRCYFIYVIICTKN